jgi:hypothetical protein
MKLISLAKLHAAKRKPGYIEAVMAVAEPVSDTHIRLSDEDFDRLRAKYAVPAPKAQPPKASVPKPQPSGPGTELKKLLATSGGSCKETCCYYVCVENYNEDNECVINTIAINFDTINFIVNSKEYDLIIEGNCTSPIGDIISVTNTENDCYGCDIEKLNDICDRNQINMNINVINSSCN